jgi:hypothetical protein
MNEGHSRDDLCYGTAHIVITMARKAIENENVSIFKFKLCTSKFHAEARCGTGTILGASVLASR